MTVKHKKVIIFIILAAVITLAMSAFMFQGCASDENADTTFSYTMTSHDINCNINTDCSLSVTESVTLKHFGQFVVYIPVENKVRIRDVSLSVATEGDDGVVRYSDPGYSVTSEKDRVIVKADDGGNWEDMTYVVSYTVKNIPLTNTSTSDYVDFTLMGTDWNLIQSNVTVTINMPNGYIDTNEALPTCVNVFNVTSNGKTNVSPEDYSVEENTFTYTLDTMSAWNGLSFRFFFNNGVMSNNYGSDILPWMLLLIGVVIATGAILLKIFVFNEKKKRALLIGDVQTKKSREIKFADAATSVGVADRTGAIAATGETGSDDMGSATGETAAAGMPTTSRGECLIRNTDALNMEILDVRRVLERKIERRDVVTILLCWANEGYISFNIKNANNPVIVQNVKSLPGNVPKSWQALFDEIFIKGDRTGVKTLSKGIIEPVRAIIDEANARYFTGYNKLSIAVACVLAVLTSLFISFIPAFLPMRVSPVAFSPIYFVSIAPALVVFIFMALIYAARHRLGKIPATCLSVVAMLIGIACVVIYIVTIPDGAYALAPRIIASILSLVATVASASLIMYSDEYNKKLGDANDLEQFIMSVDPDEIDRMLEDDPACYYRVLPYALTLRMGITWGDKFMDKTITPPTWLTPIAPTAKFSAIREDIKNLYDMILAKTDELCGKKT